MPKPIRKYFIAIVPEDPLREEISALKQAINDRFGFKYALKSPPHITLKMPFSHNENNEQHLADRLRRFFEEEKPFSLRLSGVGHFGTRVAYLRVHGPPDLPALQARLVRFGKRRLGQQIELSDLNYQPHLTVAFRDIKKERFDELMNFLRQRFEKRQMNVQRVALIKKTGSVWEVLDWFELKG